MAGAWGRIDGRSTKGIKRTPSWLIIQKKTGKWPFFPKIDTFDVGFHYFDYGMDFKKG